MSQLSTLVRTLPSAFPTFDALHSCEMMIKSIFASLFSMAACSQEQQPESCADVREGTSLLQLQRGEALSTLDVVKPTLLELAVETMDHQDQTVDPELAAKLGTATKSMALLLKSPMTEKEALLQRASSVGAAEIMALAQQLASLPLSTRSRLVVAALTSKKLRDLYGGLPRLKQEALLLQLHEANVSKVERIEMPNTFCSSLTVADLEFAAENEDWKQRPIANRSYEVCILCPKWYGGGHDEGTKHLNNIDQWRKCTDVERTEWLTNNAARIEKMCRSVEGGEPMTKKKPTRSRRRRRRRRRTGRRRRSMVTR